MEKLSNPVGRQRSIRGKLTAPVLACAGLAAVLVAGVSTLRDGQRDTALAMGRLSDTAKAMASLSGEAAAAGDRARANGVIRSFVTMPGVDYAQIRGANGALLAEAGARGRLSQEVGAKGGAAAALLNPGPATLTVPIEVARRRVGEVMISGRLPDGRERLLSNLLISLGAALAAAVAGLALAARLRRDISEPVAALAEAAPVTDSQDDGPIGDERPADAARRDLLAVLSHEIRTPMDGIAAMAGMLAAGDLPPGPRRLAEVIARSAASLPAIFDDIADGSRLAPGQPELAAAPVDVAEVAEDVLGLFWGQARAKGLDLAAFIDPATPALVSGDPVRLRQVIGALVNNAIRFTQTGGVMVQVMPAGEGRLKISVHDTGVGIAPERIDGLFAAGAPGLGLALCKRLVEAMGGVFKVTSKLGKGTVFAFELPLETLEPARPWPVFPPGQAAAVALGGTSTPAALSRYLKASGLGVAAPDAEGARVIFGDAESLNAQPRSSAPTVCVAGYGDAAPVQLQRQGQADRVLVQPLCRRELAATLEQVLAGQPIAEAVAEERAAAPALAVVSVLPSAPAAATPAVGAPTGPLVTSDLLDPQVAIELARMAAMGKADFVDRVRRLYRENAPEAVRGVIDASVAGDAAGTAKAAHALKSMSLNMGARVVAESASRIEAQARELGVVNVDQAQILHRQLLATLDVLDGYPPTKGSPPPPTSADTEEQALLADLAAAIANSELSLVYQPQFDRDGETITGVETLLRWNHPVRGFVSPAMFIPLAERHGMIGPITQWVLDRAMTETEGLGDNLVISFNASAVEFADPSFVDELSVLIARRRFDPRRLEIEVTETAVLAEEDEVRRNMARLHELGLKIALDDFGVGYSSLSHLRLFPFDKLKIDRAFVTGCADNVQSATLVHAVVAIGRSLGMKVVAEGVETDAQRKFLKVAGVHAMQGYLFARPEPIAALRSRLGLDEAMRA